MSKRTNSRAERDTHNYTLYGVMGQEVYHGITSQKPETRIQQHERAGKFFTGYSVSAVRSRQRAESDETAAIHHHQDQNFGIPPQYNKAKVKKNDWGLW
jgi:hypothetical protein